MTYALMIFFVLAVVTALYGFTSFEGGGEPGAAAMARLLSVSFAIACAGSGLALLIDRRTRGGGDDRSKTRASPEQPPAGADGFGSGWSASERGSWDGVRRCGRIGARSGRGGS